ncbi:MAG: M16 family metallopeptidase [Longimicrobiaceae bacterium]
MTKTSAWRPTSPPPPAGPAPLCDFPEVRRFTLSCGLPVRYVYRPALPLTVVRLVADAGSTAEPVERPGLGSLTAAMLDQGTSRSSALEISDRIDFLGASLDADADRDAGSLTLTSLTRNLVPALELFAEVATDATFPDQEWARVQKQELASLTAAADQPDTVAGWTFSELLYGADHPYGHPSGGTRASVGATSAGDLRGFFRARYRPGRTELMVVGSAAQDELTAALEQGFGGWGEAEREPAPPPPPPATPEATRIFLLDRPGAPQSEVRAGHLSVPRAHADWLPLLLLNYALGGQFSSRINLNLREDKGYTYGAATGFEPRVLAGPFKAAAAVQTEVTADAVRELIRELEEVQESQPVSEEELAFAQLGIRRREPLQLETNAQIAGRIEGLIVYGLPDDYYHNFGERIGEVQLDEVRRVAREQLRPDRLTVVVVGDRAAVEAGLRALPYPVEVARPAWSK